jgi:hypothetical protein
LNQQLSFMERRNDTGPDLSMFAQLLAQAGSAPQNGGGGGSMFGAPMTIDSSSIPYQMPGFMFGGGYMPRGSQLQRGSGNRGVGYGGGFGGLMGGGSIPGFPGIYPGSGGGGGMGGELGGTDPDLILNGRVDDDYDYNWLFGDGPSYGDYEWGSYPF